MFKNFSWNVFLPSSGVVKSEKLVVSDHTYVRMEAMLYEGGWNATRFDRSHDGAIRRVFYPLSIQF
jgi:hypothetical protein